VAQAAGRLHLLDQLLERHVLVRVGVEGDVAHPCQELYEAGISRHVGAQHERVDEEADEVFELGMGAARDRGPHRDVVRSAVADEQ
jgi:hypothetical protein